MSHELSRQSRSTRKRNNGPDKLLQTSKLPNFFKYEKRVSEKTRRPEVIDVHNVTDAPESQTAKRLPISTTTSCESSDVGIEVATESDSISPATSDDSPVIVDNVDTVPPPNGMTRTSTKESNLKHKTISAKGSDSSKPFYSIFDKKGCIRARVADKAVDVSDKQTLQDNLTSTISETKDVTTSTGDSEVSDLSDPIIVIEETTEILDKCSPSNPILPCDFVDVECEASQTTTEPRVSSLPQDNSGSQENPIMICSSPAKSFFKSANNHLPRTLSLYDDHIRPRSIQSPPIKKHKKNTKEWDTPLPETISQHVKGIQNVFQSTPLAFQRREKPATSSSQSISLANTDIAKSILYGVQDFTRSAYLSVERFGSSYDYQQQANKIMTQHQHPAISRFRSSHVRERKSDIWSEKWRPRCALEVLGNEDSAVYLRLWLLALAVHTIPQDSSNLNQINADNRKNIAQSLQHPRQTKITRSVDKKRKPRKRRKLDSEDESEPSDWLVSDVDEISDGKEADTDSDPADNLLKDEEPRLRKRPHQDDTGKSDNLAIINTPVSEAENEFPELSHDFSSYLTNTILISGPPGSGKTAAVYACAEELNWDVLEVYPGIGKRNGANLSAMIGEAGKNHIVGKAQPRRNLSPHAETSRTNFHCCGNSLKNRNERKAAETHCLGECTNNLKLDSSASVNRSSERNAATAKDSKPISSPSTQQSLILLEEVDILYNDDTNFWPAVINFIRECRRPVILTCNDPEIIPLSEIPLQSRLSFSPAPTDLAAAYLQLIALQEGYSLYTEDVSALYESPCDLETSDLSGLARSNARHPQSLPDIRRAINNLQFVCQANSNSSQHHQDNKVKYDNDPSRGSSDQASTNEDSTVDSKTIYKQMRILEQISENDSFANSHIERRPEASMEVYTFEGVVPSADDEIGYRRLYNPSINTENRCGIAFYNWDNRIAKELFSMAQESEIDGKKYEEEALFNSQKMHILRTESMLDRIMGSEAIALNMSKGVILDYEAWIRIMVREDDRMEEELRGKRKATDGQRRFRRGRGEVFMDYERWISLSEGQRRIMRDTAFRVD